MGIGKGLFFYFLSLWEMILSLDLALEKEAEGRRHDRRCMIAIKIPVCAPLTPVTGSYSWATPYPAFPGALSKPHCGESLNRGLIRGEYETDIVKSKGGGKMGKAQRFPTPFHDPG